MRVAAFFGFPDISAMQTKKMITEVKLCATSTFMGKLAFPDSVLFGSEGKEGSELEQ